MDSARIIIYIIILISPIWLTYSIHSLTQEISCRINIFRSGKVIKDLNTKVIYNIATNKRTIYPYILNLISVFIIMFLIVYTSYKNTQTITVYRTIINERFCIILGRDIITDVLTGYKLDSSSVPECIKIKEGQSATIYSSGFLELYPRL